MKQKDTLVELNDRIQLIEEAVRSWNNTNRTNTEGITNLNEYERVSGDRIKSLEDKMMGISKSSDDRLVQTSKIASLTREVRDVEKYLYAVRNDLKIIETRINELSDAHNLVQVHLSKSWFSRTFGL